MAGTGFLREVRLDELPAGKRDHYPFSIPAVAHLVGAPLTFHPSVTFLAGENGSGKSTLIEAIAMAAGFNPEGGPRNLRFSRHSTEATLHDDLTLAWHARPPDGFFLRAETFFNVATALEELDDGGGSGAFLSEFYGGSLHAQSHGESFLSLVLHRLGRGQRPGLFLLDEPEAAFSFQGCLRLLAGVHDLVGIGCQFVIATHSPVLLAYPDAVIYQLDAEGIARVAYHDTDAFQLTSAFLEAPERFLRHLLESE